MAKVTIVAELGSSPMPRWAFDEWCAAAANAGATSCKVQLFRADVIYPPHMRPAMRDREFPRARYREFVQCAHAYGLVAGASVFDGNAVLYAEWGDYLKLAASQRLNTELRRHCAATYKPVYRSVEGFETDPWSNETTLYAIQRYPAPMLASVRHLMQAARYYRGRKWGWSSHTSPRGGTWDCILAARLGASVIERHFCLSHQDVEGPHSSTPAEFTKMVRAIRR